MSWQLHLDELDRIRGSEEWRDFGLGHGGPFGEFGKKLAADKSEEGQRVLAIAIAYAGSRGDHTAEIGRMRSQLPPGLQGEPFGEGVFDD